MGDLVSVIIPTYNRPQYLERAVKSVLNQTYKDIEIIIIDDNGNNPEFQKATKEVYDQFKYLLNVRYVKNEYNMGGAKSRNEGVRQANGNYISFLDDDDEYEVDKIKEQMKVMISNKNFDVCYCGLKYLDSKGNYLGQRKIYVEGSEDLIRKHIFRPITGTPALLMKKSTFQEINGFDNLKRYQDANLIFKILAYNYNITCVKKELVKVYIHDQERISTKGKWIQSERDYIKNTINYIDKISLANSKRLTDKYHIVNCFCKDEKKVKILMNIAKKLKLRVLIISNLLGIINYINKSEK